MGQGSDTAFAQIVGEVLDVMARMCASSLRIPTSRLTIWARWARARCFTWAPRCGSPPRMPAPKLRVLATEAGLPEGTNYPPAEIFKKRYGMQAGNVIGTAS